MLRVAAPPLVQANRTFYRILRDGVEVEYRRDDGSIAGDRVRLVDFDGPANDWLVVNQFAVADGQPIAGPISSCSSTAFLWASWS